MARTAKRRESFQNLDMFSRLGLNKSYVSLALGIIVVILVGLVGLALIRGGDGLQNVSLRDILTGQQEKVTEQPSGETYMVKEGDNLWTISENFYKSGYNWVDIAKENNLDNPDSIEVGQSLRVPKDVKIISPVQEVVGRIEGNSYKVLEGDNLWDISVRAYGDGYKWVEVAKKNNLVNPNFLFVGTNLTLPR